MVRVAQASIDERGHAIGGQSGNQTGRELNVSNWYQHGWTQVIRFKNRKKAEQFAKVAETLANNKCIGYDQSGRATLYNDLSKLNFAYDKLSAPCETDCSAFAVACLNCIGIKANPNANTSSMWEVCKATEEFELLTDSKYLASSDYLQVGDILNRPASHVVIVLDNGCKANADKLVANKPTTSPISKPKPKASVYTVKIGDTLSTIAQAHKTTVDKLVKLNGIKNSNLIFKGQKIKIK